MTAEAPLKALAGENPPPLCPGFRMQGVACDVRGKKDGRLDLALIHSASPCAAAGLFTRNAVRAAPVIYCQEILDTPGPWHGILANSGNANALTGSQGGADTRAMARAAEEATDAPPGSFLVCSTGRIGRPLPMERLRAGIPEAARQLSAAGASARAAARAILTSDTREKTAVRTFETGGGSVTLAGIAKGAGMIEPNMATMLAFILTDAAIGRELLQTALRRAARGTFNAISVDGAMSTNDTVLALANGRAAAIEETDQPAWKGFCAALEAVCASLARKIVADGECISKVITLEVSGAPSDAGAEAVARRIANSMLTKSAWYGSDPNWGRVACDVGAAGVALDPNRLTIAYDGVRVCADGGPLPAAMPAAAEVCARPAFTISVGLGAGPGRFRLLTTDLTEAYVAFNMSE